MLILKVFRAWQSVANLLAIPDCKPGGLQSHDLRRDHLTPNGGLASPANHRSDVGEISRPELVRAVDRPVAAEVDHAFERRDFGRILKKISRSDVLIERAGLKL